MATNVTAERLLTLKNTIERTKTLRSQAEGRLASLQEQLQRDHGVKTVEAARVKLEKIQEQLEKLSMEEERGLEEAEELLG